MKEVRELVLRIRPNDKVKGFYAVDISLTINGIEREMHELLKDSDIKPRLDEMLELAKKGVLDALEEYD